ncbi:hypothetical protein PHLCEN_2v12566 [Hermanssonia centrifuga]|uniref:Uncharacterized protein n=1 Tax=Hermanssonia centrifuga TaxID=98765 RepID=A0A2R6NGP5_9APHY|nr:hypothetical protein PHLCEN_2v12566 [Hermanssonia centrifuga]
MVSTLGGYLQSLVRSLAVFYVCRSLEPFLSWEENMILLGSIPEESANLSTISHLSKGRSKVDLYLRPKTTCFTGGTNYADFQKNTILARSYEIASNMSRKESRKLLIAQQREADALYKTQFEVCDKTMGDLLRYMGTSTVVRDIDFITTQLEGEDALM